MGIETDARVGHSRLGIASVPFSVMALFVVAIAVSVFFGIVLAAGPDGIMDDPAADILGGLILFGLHVLALFLDLLGLGFAVGGSWQGQRKKTFAVFGMVLAIVTLFVLVLSYWAQTGWFSQNKYY